jgi:energy-coupling factor transporter ATP-binding protein EcfA2
MKVHSLWIREYRVLRDIEILFSPHPRPGQEEDGDDAVPRAAHALDLLVGVNGTGKSTALRALVEVLQRIEGKTSAADLLFRITYERSKDERITITNVDDHGTKLLGKFRVWTGGNPTPQELDDVRQYAPAAYVTYTTGREAPRAVPASDVDPGLLRTTTEGDYWLREKAGDPPAPAPPPRTTPTQSHFEVTAHDLPLVSLCGLLQHAAQPPAHVIVREALEDLGVAQLSAFSLRIDTPLGTSSSLLEKTIADLRTAAARTRVQGSAYTFVFDLHHKASQDPPSPADLAERQRKAGQVLAGVSDAFRAESPVGLFRELAAYSRPQAGFPPALTRVDLFLERRPLAAVRPALHTYDWLSDGERTFLARMCLLSLFGAANALILLDEPEVHFNDYWKRKLVRLVDSALDGYHSHAIITTHSSIVLTDARVRQITVLDRGGDGYTRKPLEPGVPTFAGDPSDVLMHVFGAEAAAGSKSVNEVREVLRAYEHALARPPGTEGRKKLHNQLERLHRDLGPGYWRFRVADALSRYKE